MKVDQINPLNYTVRKLNYYLLLHSLELRELFEARGGDLAKRLLSQYFIWNLPQVNSVIRQILQQSVISVLNRCRVEIVRSTWLPIYQNLSSIRHTCTTLLRSSDEAASTLTESFVLQYRSGSLL